MLDAALIARANHVLIAARAAGTFVATAESCTGGLVAAALTDIPGASDVFERGFVTYSNAAKTALLGVPADLINTHGAVSEAVARAMAEGAIAKAGVGAAVAITGIAGPGGGSLHKPVGLVHIAAARLGRRTLHAECRFGDPGRGSVRLLAAHKALDLLAEILT